MSSIEAYPTGCTLRLQLAARRGARSRDEWDSIREDLFVHHHQSDERIADVGQVRFGIEFADGSRATSLDERAFGFGPDGPTRPDPPVLGFRDGTGSGGARSVTQEVELWIWPLPPEGSVTLHFAWPAMDVPSGSVELDATAIRAAADSVQPYWP